MTTTVDVLIIGAGASGAAVAWSQAAAVSGRSSNFLKHPLSGANLARGRGGPRRGAIDRTGGR
jgi:flavin-dependent dehydrogenase